MNGTPQLSRLLTAKGDILVRGSSGFDEAKSVGSNGHVLTADSAEATGMKWAAPATSGTVTSVAQTVPDEFSIAGSPVTSSGTLAISKATQTANTLWAGPTTGSAAQPTFRAMVAADIAPVPNFLFGVTFVYTDAHTITLDPSVNNPSGTALIVLWDGSALKLFTVSSSKTCDLAASGAGGLDTGAESASTGYYVWGIGKSDGTFALLFSVSATAPTMPSGYTYKRLLYFVRNGTRTVTTDIVKFWCTDDGRGSYYDVGSTAGDQGDIISGGTATTPTAVDLTGFVPTGASTARMWSRALVNAAGVTAFEIHTSSTGLEGYVNAALSTSAGYPRYISQGVFEIPILSTLSASIHYAFDVATAGRSALIRCRGWKW